MFVQQYIICKKQPYILYINDKYNIEVMQLKIVLIAWNKYNI